MHIPDFLKLGALYIVGLAILKIIFGEFLDTTNQNLLIVFLAVCGIYAVALIRRAGVITYLEALVVPIIWTVVLLLVDYLITANIFLGLEMYKSAYVWLGYLVPMAAIFCFHKKRHVHIRRGGHVDSHH